MALGLACPAHSLSEATALAVPLGAHPPGLPELLSSPSARPPLGRYLGSVALCWVAAPPGVGLCPLTILPALAALPSLDAPAHASCLADSPLSQCLKGQHLKASAGAREGEQSQKWRICGSRPLHAPVLPPGAAARAVTDSLSDPRVSALWRGMLSQVLIQRMQTMQRENQERRSRRALSPQGDR